MEAQPRKRKNEGKKKRDRYRFIATTPLPFFFKMDTSVVSTKNIF
jgi:hypothetical protein